MESLSGIWAAISPAVGNHLWQSTLFAIVTAMLTFTLRKNQARVRYRLWLAASVKFLIPFSLLISLGGHLARPRNSVAAQSGLYSVAEGLSQPFTRTAAPDVVPVARAARAVDLLPLVARPFSRGFGCSVLSWRSVYGGDAGGDSRWRCAAQ